MAITPVRDLVQKAKSRIDSLSTAEARRRAERGEALLVDIRDIRELQRGGRIPGSVHAPRGMLEFWVDPESPYHKPELAQKPLILFCASAWRSALAAAALQDMGVEGVCEMEGGFTAWQQEGGPVEPLPDRA